MLKQLTMKNILFLILFTYCTNFYAQNNYFELFTDSTALKDKNDKLISDIEKQIQRIEPTFSFNGLTTEVPKNFMIGQFKSKSNKIYHVTWQTSKPMEPFLTAIAGSAELGKQMAAYFFYGFFLPHEVGHAFQFQTGNVPDNNYDSEYQANEFAVLYWKANGRENELQKCYELAKSALKNLKNPIPENVDAKKYITENYNELMRDPSKYGYIQFSQIVKIIDDKSLPNFDTYVKKVFQKK